jgi:hypothetical protein
LIGHNAVDRAGAGMVDLDKCPVLPAEIDKAKVVVDHPCVIGAGPKTDSRGFKLVERGLGRSD